MAVYLSTMALDTTEQLGQTLRNYEEAGIQRVELGSGHEYYPDVLQDVESYDLEYLVHNCFPPCSDKKVLNLASQDRRRLDAAIDHCKDTINLCRQWDIGLYSVHAGWRFDAPAEMLGQPLWTRTVADYEVAYDTFVGSLTSLCDFASQVSVRIAVEPNVLAPFNLRNGMNEMLLMCEEEETVRLLRDVSKPNLGVLLDVGHLHVNSKTLGFDKHQFVETVSDSVFAVHLHENDGLADQHLLLSEDAWFWDVLNQFVHVPWVIESRHPSVMALAESVKLAERFARGG